MKRKSLILLFSIVMMLGLALAGCGGGDKAASGDDNKVTQDKASQNVTSDSGDAAAEIDKEQVLHLTETAEPPDLDSAKATYTVSFEVLNAVISGLTRVDKDGNPIPELAEKWEISEDGKTYTFHLRDAKWSNGDPVTANDFKFAWMRTIDANTAAQYSFIMTDYIKGAQEYYDWTAYSMDNAAYLKEHDNKKPAEAKPEDVAITVVDDKTLKVELVSPTEYFLSLAAFPTFLPQNEKFVKSVGENYATDADKMIYNGSFTMTSWTHEKGWTFEKNPNYWDADTVKLQKVIVDVVKDGTTSVNLYEAGDIDMAYIPSEQVPLYQDKPEYFTFTDLAHFYIVFNQDKNNYKGPNPDAIKALANVKVRKAISLALDRKGHADIVLNNGSLPAYGFVPFGIRGFREANGDLFKDDPELAKQLFAEGLKEAGVSADSFKKVRYLTGDTESARKTAEFMKENLRNALGIDLDIQQVTFQERLERSRTGDFDMVLSGWGPDYNDPMTFMDLLITDGPYNDGGYTNAKVDELIAAAKVEMDSEKRMKMLMDAEKIMIGEEMAVAPYYFRANAVVLRDYVKNLHFHGIGPERDYKWAFIQGKQK